MVNGVFIDERGNEIDQLWIDGELMTKLYDEDASFEFKVIQILIWFDNNEKKIKTDLMQKKLLGYNS